VRLQAPLLSLLTLWLGGEPSCRCESFRNVGRADRPSKRITCFIVGLALLVGTLGAMGQGLFPTAPSTTLTAETANNTSAADTFISTNGNMSGANVSKVPLRNLLYDNAATKIYAHFVGWFGGRDHIDVGYQSADPLQVHKQVADMVSRGIDGAIIDWYGPHSSNRSQSAVNTETATASLMKEAEQLNGFEFAIMVDKGALRNCREQCDPTQELIKQMTYVYDNYEQSPAYMRVNGRPVVLFFGIDRNHQIDWKRVARTVPGEPILVTQDRQGFGEQNSQGAYSWVHPDKTNPRNWRSDYLDWFYKEGQKAGDAANVLGTVYKGFDDTMASWSENRVLSQDCGRTWLRTWEKIAQHYSATQPLQALQMVTWNDYEEGTELESGIDNCVAIHSWHSGDFVKWHLGWTSARHDDLVKNGPDVEDDSSNWGNSPARNGPNAEVRTSFTPQDGVDHFAIFASSDREHLSQVAEAPNTDRNFNVASLQLPAGRYYVYVQAVGKPGLLNHMSAPVIFDVSPQP
jgi:glycosyl hydrolase family 71